MVAKKNFSVLFLAMFVPMLISARYVVVNDTLHGSDTYPGTSHAFQLTIPEGYNGDAAALYLGLDGILCRAPQVIDSLVCEGVMPTTIGVYLQPGVVKDDSGKVIRYNRSNEFDATDARFTMFLERESLPAIETRHGVKFSLNPTDRMIFGLSSGGIAAFTAAWHRPDMFAKVFCGCGTFVPMRGGNELQAIVRKHEPRSLRIFLQDGFKDSWNPLFGSWFEANFVLGTALEFAGYDARFDWAEGVHSVRRASEIFTDVMKWMWRDYPNAVKVGKTNNNLLAPMLIADEYWEECTAPSDLQLAAIDKVEAIYPDSTLMAKPMEGSNYLAQYILDADGQKMYGQAFYWLHNYNNAALTVSDMTFDGTGNLWVLTNAGIQICDQNGRVRGILDLPRGFDVEKARIAVTDGCVWLKGDKYYSRRLNVAAAKPGVSPESQGQA